MQPALGPDGFHDGARLFSFFACKSADGLAILPEPVPKKHMAIPGRLSSLTDPSAALARIRKSQS
jgi:hypothetical protein